MSRRLSATVGMLHERIFKSLMTRDSGLKYHLRQNMFYIHTYVYLGLYIFAAVLELALIFTKHSKCRYIFRFSFATL